jgi:hypothetical protein
MPISMAELQQKILDPHTPEEEIKQYFKANPDTSQPFAPAVIPDPEKVEIAAPARDIEAAILSDWANDLSRLRRQTVFETRMILGDSRPVLVSEGDSWFQFPFLLEDVIDHLGDDFNVWSVDAAGDTLQRMVIDSAEFMQALRKNVRGVRAFLFSGAGNDVIGKGKDGESILAQILRPFESGRPAEWYLETEELAKQLRFIEDCYRQVLTNVAAEFPALPVICHGYDYAIPGGFPGDPRRPGWASQDQWLARPLNRLGIRDPALQQNIIRLLIDRLNERIRSLCGGNVRNGAFRTAWHVDARGGVDGVRLWADELHPTDSGFARVASRFAHVLRMALSAQETSGVEAAPRLSNLYDLTGSWVEGSKGLPGAAVGMRPQAQVFGFASEWAYLVDEWAPQAASDETQDNHVLAEQAIRLLSSRFPGLSLMVGFDMDAFNPADTSDYGDERRQELDAFEDLIARLSDAGTALSIRIDPAWGPADSRWERWKAKRFIAAAVAAGLVTDAKAPRLVSAGKGNVRLTQQLKALTEAWDKGGYFWPHAIAQLRDFRSRGFVAAEIDNLDGALAAARAPSFERKEAGLSGRLGFYRSYADEYVKGTIPALILKNLDAEAFAAIEARLGKLGVADDPARLPRVMFADFHILEADGLDQTARDQVARASARIGIQTLFSDDANQYCVYGRFGQDAMDGLASVTVTGGVRAAEAGTTAMAEAALGIEAVSVIDLTPSQRLVCERIINVFETGTIQGRYGAISIFNDGPHRIRQITYGRAQTTEYGNLRELVQRYVDAGGRFATELRPFIAKIKVEPLVDNSTFKTLLRRAGNEDPLMARVQDAFFEDRYFQHAKLWAEQHGFTRALSMLVIYDSFIHSGSILGFLRDRFRERPPSQGGNEMEWIRQYVDVRHDWLRTHSNPDLRPTIYRTRDLTREIARGNWDLSRLPISANGTPVDDRQDVVTEGLIPETLGPERAFDARPSPATAERPAGYEWRGLDISAFLQRNRTRLVQEIAAVNGILAQSYGPDAVPLTEQDVWVLTYIEAGLSGGHVDPDFRHSQGERGMLPLPGNVDFWNGRGAPRPNRPMPIEANLHHFYLYLGHLMNKKVREAMGFSLYEGLFRWGTFGSDPSRKARLLAAVVHGYFLSANYTDRRVPFRHVLEGFDRGDPADVVMRPTTYVHAGRPLIANRERNIGEALRLIAQAGPAEPGAPERAAGWSEPLTESAPHDRDAAPMPFLAERADSGAERPASPQRFKLKFHEKEALQAAASGPEAADMPGGRIDWKRDTMIVEGTGEDPGAFQERTLRIAEEYGADIVPDVQYDIDDLYDPGPESETDPTLEDVVQMIRADRVWGRVRGAGVTIAVVDTGVQGSRPEFRNKVHWHPGLTADSNLSPWEDTNGHGTMCAAIAAGQGGMGTARDGIAPEAHILPCRTTTFFDSDIVRFYDNLIERAANGETIVVTNSFGIKTGSPPPLIDHDLIDVLMKAEDAGIHIFFSAGNNHEATGASHSDCKPNSIWLHKSYDCLTTVGTCDLDRQVWSYSSRGPGQFFGEARTRQMPDIIAPTPKNGRIAYGVDDRTLTRGWGTSGACPQAAGLAALILSHEPMLRPAEVRDIIMNTARSIGVWGATCQGQGMLDCEAALNRLPRRSRLRQKRVELESRAII